MGRREGAGEALLPLGSVVRARGVSTPVMIVGIVAYVLFSALVVSLWPGTWLYGALDGLASAFVVMWCLRLVLRAREMPPLRILRPRAMACAIAIFASSFAKPLALNLIMDRYPIDAHNLLAVFTGDYVRPLPADLVLSGPSGRSSSCSSSRSRAPCWAPGGSSGRVPWGRPRRALQLRGSSL